MAYIKTNWQAGDTITANKLNNIENGIESLSTGGGGTLIIHENYGTLDKTWQEIYNAMKTGLIVYIYDESSEGITIFYVLSAWMTTTDGGNEVYYVDALRGANGMVSYSTTATDDYPIQEENPK